MARVTVEDCVIKIPNRFDLVLKAAQRSRQISSGAELTVDRDNDKNPVVALREIADETIDLEELNEAIIHSMQKFVEVDEPEEDDLSLLLAGRKAAQSNEPLTPEALDAANVEIKEEVAATEEAEEAEGKEAESKS